MRQVRINFIIDLLSFIGFVLLTTTGVLMRYMLPPGSGKSSAVWGLDRHQWGDIHFWVSLVFFALLVLHLVLHWRWIVNVMRGSHGNESGLRFGLGMVGLLAVVALSLAPVFAPVEKKTAQPSGLAVIMPQKTEIEVRGSMTLDEVAAQAGMPVARLREALGIPPGETVQRLGQLKQVYGFEMEDVREAVGRHRD